MSMERDQALQWMHDLLGQMLGTNGSDLFITAGFPPAIKIDGKLTPVTGDALTAPQSAALVRALMTERQSATFELGKECNFAISPPGLGRFRISAFVQMGAIGMVVRTITSVIPKLEELGLPSVLQELVLSQRGLIIMTGATGSGKSTTLAAMVGYRNQHSHGHIITIEDPVEYVHPHGNCIMTQREVGVDTEDWSVALKNALRQAPDVIQIGEIRDRETMDHAIAFAETGHLCLATLHANSANQALDRIINFFPEERRQQLLMDLSLNLKSIISQRLIARTDGAGRCVAIEILLNTPLVSDLIFKGQVREIKDLMKKSRELGMQTFDQSLFDLFEAGTISYEDALRNADSVNDLRLAIKLNGKAAQGASANMDHLGLV